MSGDEHASPGQRRARLTRAEQRALIQEFGLNRPVPLTRTVLNARARARKWRDERHDAGLPDNRLIGNLAFQLLLCIDAEKLAVGKPGLDAFFATLIGKLPKRFDRAATEKTVENAIVRRR